MTFVIFILTLSILVFVHELGHFLVAKKNGIRVEEFGLGMPPRVIGKKVGDTLYSLNLLPFGGFVKLTGEEVESEDEEVTLEKDPRSFVSKSASQRVAVLVAGVTMNMILAVTLYYFLLISTGFKTFTIPLLFDYTFKFGQIEKTGTVVMDVQKDSGAQKAGVLLGDAVKSIDGVSVNSITELRNELKGKAGQEVQVEILDMQKPFNSVSRTVTAIPTEDENGNVLLGVYLGDAVSITYSKPHEKLFAGFLHSYNVLDYSIKAMGNVISASFKAKDITPVSSSVAGPVGVYNIVGSILNYGGSHVFLSMLDFIALMSLSLAFINILPFPALDGGRIVFILIEKVMGKRVNPLLEAKIHKIGISLLFGLLILISIKDLNIF